MTGMLFKALAPVGPWAVAVLLTASDVAAEPSAPLVTAAPAVREVVLSGFTRARADLPLTAETAGRVEAVPYDIGDTVGPDGGFARLDATFIELELTEVKIQKEQLQARIAHDQREVKRHTELARRNNTPVSRLDTLRQALRDNRYELQALEVRQQVLQERLRRTRIPAPVGWRITDRSLEPGQWVQAGERVGAAADFSALIVPFALTPEQYRALVAFGSDDLSLRLQGPERDLAAAIYRTNPGFDPVTRKIAVDLVICDPVEPLRGGLRAQLGLYLPERSGAVLLPAGVVESGYEEFWVIREDGQRLRVMLLGSEPGPAGEQLRVAAPGLEPGQRFRLLRKD